MLRTESLDLCYPHLSVILSADVPLDKFSMQPHGGVCGEGRGPTRRAGPLANKRGAFFPLADYQLDVVLRKPAETEQGRRRGL